jgi:mycothiol synthase
MPNFSIRHYNLDSDISVLSRMLTEIESIDHDGEETSEEFLRSMKAWRNFDPDQNVWIAEMDGEFVGYGQVLPHPESHASIYVVVHPVQRRKGLGTRLLSLVLERARKTETHKIIVDTTGHNAASNAFLQHHGFELAGTSGVMVAPVGELPLAELPQGYSIRRYLEMENPDPALVVQGLDRCYKDQVGHHQNVTSADRFINYYGGQGIHLLFDDEQNLIGICAAKPAGYTDESPPTDLLDAPGIVGKYRQGGYQRYLALTAMHWLRRQGSRPITLEYWGDDEQAIAIYRGLGFNVVRQQLTYNKELQ